MSSGKVKEADGSWKTLWVKIMIRAYQETCVKIEQSGPKLCSEESSIAASYTDSRGECTLRYEFRASNHKSSKNDTDVYYQEVM